uniref:Uncharacterized protein n=1 Tax=Strigamia maritima TaxID=126957 RepID=T1INN7_STRMM
MGMKNLFFCINFSKYHYITLSSDFYRQAKVALIVKRATQQTTVAADDSTTQEHALRLGDYFRFKRNFQENHRNGFISGFLQTRNEYGPMILIDPYYFIRGCEDASTDVQIITTFNFIFSID